MYETVLASSIVDTQTSTIPLVCQATQETQE